MRETPRLILNELEQTSVQYQLTFPEFHFETEAKVDFPSACIQQRRQNFEQKFSILNRALSWAIASFGNKFCLRKRSRLIKALDNRFYLKFMRLEIGLFVFMFPPIEKVNK